jgi:iron(III) transport system substrate-binding protein
VDPAALKAAIPPIAIRQSLVRRHHAPRIVYVKERVKQTPSPTRSWLTKWKGKICIRSGQHVYNTSLIATIIAHKGEAFAETWLKGVKDNLAHKPAGGDREQARDIYSGKCDIALGNTYYMALMATNDKNPEQKAWGAAIKPLFPNAADCAATSTSPAWRSPRTRPTRPMR